MKNIQETGVGLIGEVRDLALRIRDDKTTVEPEDVMTLNDALTALVGAINGRISLGEGPLTSGQRAGNLNGQWIEVAFPSSANAEIEIFHGLQRIPGGCLITPPDRAASIYYSNKASWTDTKLMLKSSVANAVVWVLVF